MKKTLSTLLFTASMYLSLTAQPSIKWSRNFGGGNNDAAKSILQTADGGYIVAGETNSNDGDVIGNHGTSDFWLLKLDKGGALQWQKCFGGTHEEVFHSIQQTTDGGFILAGTTNSNDSDVSGNHDGSDYWVVKLTADGSMEWQKCYGGTDDDEAASIQQTRDGGYIVAGSSYSSDGDVSGNYGGTDYWVVKLDSKGNVQWQKNLGGSDTEDAYSIQQTDDGGYMVAGISSSADGDVSYNYGGSDYWLVKLRNDGSIQWQKSFGGSDDEDGLFIRQSSDEGYLFAGFFNGLNSAYVEGESDFYDFWIVKFDSAGTSIWQKCLGGSRLDFLHSMQQTADEGFVLGGSTSSIDDSNSGHASLNYWILKIDRNFSIEWQKTLGGTEEDEAHSIRQTADGGYVLAGTSSSTDGQLSRNHGGADIWIVKLNPGSDKLIK